MDPYRKPEPPKESLSPSEAPLGGDGILIGLNLVIGLLGLVPAITTPGPWGAEPTVALIITALCSLALARRARDAVLRFNKRRRKREDHVD